MRKYLLAIVAIAALAFATTTNLAGEKKEAKAKCPVSGKDINKDASVEFNGGLVYFCCNNCPKAFEKDTLKYTGKANLQLVVTGQAKEVKCPFTGKDLNPETKISVAGVNVCFCCNNCKGKAEKAEGQMQIDLIFGDSKKFKKAFEIKKAEK
jgi:YHS domain-containing protein